MRRFGDCKLELFGAQLVADRKRRLRLLLPRFLLFLSSVHITVSRRLDASVCPIPLLSLLSPDTSWHIFIVVCVW